MSLSVTEPGIYMEMTENEHFIIEAYSVSGPEFRVDLQDFFFRNL